MTTIRRECLADLESIRAVNRQAFGGDDEGRLVDLLRSGGFARLSLVAVLDDQVVGHIMLSELSIVTDRSAIRALSLAPLAVLPMFQRRGIGSMLVTQGLCTAREAGERIVIVLGDPGYYKRFGFSVARAARLRSRYSGPHFMAVELETGALDSVEGDVRYPPPFDVF